MSPHSFCMGKVFFSLLLSCLALSPAASAASLVDSPPTEVIVSGELKRWHPVTLSISGPNVSETDVVNPFSDYRLEVVFTNGATSYTVPGYFAADGQAAETSAASGDQWRVHFTPDETGTWNYTISLVAGTDVAVSEDPNAVDEMLIDNLTGSFTVSETDKSGIDLRGKGRLQYVGESYLRFANGDWFLKSGIDSPENILAYSEFDGTYSLDAVSFIKDFDPHIQDWQAGDPSWQDGKGKGIIGAINYLSEESINGAFVLVNNLGINDSEDEGNADVWPWVAHDVYDRYDVSKLAQWDILFRHMQEKGLLVHFALQEIDNDLLLNNGDLGRERKLFYREMIARFGYLNAVIWNIGEELRVDRQTNTQRKAYIDYIRANDPYAHPIVAHTWPGDDQYDPIYGDLLGYPNFEGISFQIHLGSEATGDLKVYDLTKKWHNNAIASGRKWAIMMDECCGWKTGVRPWGEDYNLDNVRVDVLWGNLMAGGAGVEWFFGDRKPMQYDLSTEDFRDYELMWAYTRHAMSLFHTLPFHEMEPQTNLTVDPEHLVFAKPGDLYAIYLREGGTPTLDFRANSGTYRIKWYNPRFGGPFQQGNVESVTVSNGLTSLGSPPGSEDEDWLVLVEKIDASNHVTADFAHAPTPGAPQTIAFTASASEATGGSIISYSWDFGDGTTGTDVAPTHTYTRAGYYLPSVTVTDNQGNTDVLGKPIIVLPVPGMAESGLLGEYYNNLTHSGTPETRLDPRINFSWGNGIPIRNINADGFTARWSGYVFPEFSEMYTFRLTVDDGGRLWVDDELLIDTWDAGGYSNTSASMNLEAGTFHSIKVEMIEASGRSDVFLYWSAPSLPEQIIPEDRLVHAGDTQLPVELISFEGIATNEGIVLSWSTASERNNAGFEIQRAIRAGTSEDVFEPVEFVAGNGSTTDASHYTYTDAYTTGHRMAYRLKQIDFDGTFSYSDVIEVLPLVPQRTALHPNYPNPFNPVTTIAFELPVEGATILTILDVTGREVVRLIDDVLPAGRHQAGFDATGLASGIYFYRLKTRQSTLTRAMLLSK